MGSTLQKTMAVKACGTESQMAETNVKPTSTATASSSNAGDNIDWNVDMEIQLFYAMRGHKPVGVNRHFQMACIHEKLKNSVQKDVTSQQIWDHLETMYDMAALHESEIVPFPNDETEFALPEEFAKEIEEKMQKTDSPTSTVSTATSSSKDNVATGRLTKELTVDDQGKEGSRSALTSGHQTSGSSKAKDKETGPTTTSTAKELDCGAAVEQQKRKRNARDSQSTSKSSNTSGNAGSSSTLSSSSSKRRRN